MNGGKREQAGGIGCLEKGQRTWGHMHIWPLDSLGLSSLASKR